MKNVRTWIEIDQRALRHNVEQFLKLIPKRTRLMAVVKSNAYGHGLTLLAKQLAHYKLQNTNYKQIWFGVDSIVEALRLRREGIKNQILVLGYTLPSRIAEAAAENITLTVSSFNALQALARSKSYPSFHLKLDTGMHRQGFLPHEIVKVIKLLKFFKLSPHGIYTHFAVAKDPAYPTYTREQLKKYIEALHAFQHAGFKNYIRHAAASGGTILFPKSHLDMVRIGIGLYGYWPSLESRIADRTSHISLMPVMTWKTFIAEIKKIPEGSYIGYDLTERVHRDTTIAILPIGYWHGYDRGLSGCGEALIHGRRVKILGRISMDMAVIDVTDISHPIKTGEEVILIGKTGNECVDADELALKIGTTAYEFLTRINPLIVRTFV